MIFRFAFPGKLTFSFLIFFLLLSIRSTAQDSDTKTLIIGDILIEGNSVTNDRIILREMLVATGDIVKEGELDALLEASRINLLNTALFNFVTIQKVFSGPTVNIRVLLVERWYLWPSPIFELTDRNFNTWWESRDFTRVNYGFRLKWSNFRGRMEDLDFIVRMGKNPKFSFKYSIPYINKAKTLGIGIETEYLQNREVGYDTDSNRLLYLFDQKYLVKELNTLFQLSYRRNIHAFHSLGLEYHKRWIQDTLMKLNHRFYYPDDLSSGYFALHYKLKLDYRDARYYPLKGWYADLDIQKNGLGLPGDSPVNIFTVKSAERLYVPIAGRWYWAASFSGKWTAGNIPPYLFNKALGYERDFVRGYEYYVIDGEDYVLFRTHIKFAIVRPRESQIPGIKTPRFGRIHYAGYLTAFADAAYVNSGYPGYSNTLTNTWLRGAGLGLDLVTYYDKVFRIEYSVNKLGEYGIFIHFIAGI